MHSLPSLPDDLIRKIMHMRHSVPALLDSYEVGWVRQRRGPFILDCLRFSTTVRVQSRRPSRFLKKPLCFAVNQVRRWRCSHGGAPCCQQSPGESRRRSCGRGGGSYLDAAPQVEERPRARRAERLVQQMCGEA